MKCFKQSQGKIICCNRILHESINALRYCKKSFLYSICNIVVSVLISSKCISYVLFHLCRAATYSSASLVFNALPQVCGFETFPLCNVSEFIN